MGRWMREVREGEFIQGLVDGSSTEGFPRMGEHTLRPHASAPGSAVPSASTRPFSTRSFSSSPFWCIWRAMSHPPMNSPPMYNCGIVGHELSVCVRAKRSAGD